MGRSPKSRWDLTRNWVFFRTSFLTLGVYDFPLTFGAEFLCAKWSTFFAESGPCPLVQSALSFLRKTSIKKRFNRAVLVTATFFARFTGPCLGSHFATQLSPRLVGYLTANMPGIFSKPACFALGRQKSQLPALDQKKPALNAGLFLRRKLAAALFSKKWAKKVRFKNELKIRSFCVSKKLAAAKPQK